jgi:O-antigen/teichoic acid export membrane protein
VSEHITNNPSAEGRRHFTPSGRHLLDGAVRILLAEGLVFPTGLLIAAFLTRRLGPHDYGLYTLTVSLTLWIASGVHAIFSRATVHCVSDADDWRPIGTLVLRLYSGVSLGAAVALWLAAPMVASFYAEPALSMPLRLLALDIVLLCLAQAHRGILIGIGDFRHRAWLSATRLVTKLIFIVSLVMCGLGLTGAVLGSLGASLVELLVSRFFVRPRLFAPVAAPVSRLWSYAAPLTLTTLCFSLYGKLDVLLLKSFGGTIAQVGFYGAAQQIASTLNVLTIPFSALLLASLSRLWRAGEVESAKQLGGNAMRAVLLLLPIASLVAGASEEIVALALGEKFLPAASVLTVLIFATLAMTMVSVAMTILIAAGKPRWTLFLGGPLVVFVFIGHCVFIPWMGMLGAAFVTGGGAGVCALAAVGVVHRLWNIAPPATACWRSLIVCGVAYGLASFWRVSPLLVLCKLPLIVLVCLGLFLLLGEFTADERVMLRSVLGWPAQPRTA